MHGLIFMTWEKYLAERFGSPFLQAYRETIGEGIADIPLANRLYDDALLFAGVGAAHQLSHLPVNTLLREYGRYFILNGLTNHLCMYILSEVHNGRDLLLSMRDSHARLRRTLDGLVPPLFDYEQASRPDEITLLYESPRQLCPILFGAIEGAAERYGQSVRVREQSCMKRGAQVCRFRASFSAPRADFNRYDSPERESRRAVQKMLMKQIWVRLPEAGTVEGLTLKQIQDVLKRYHRTQADQLRPAILVEALSQLQFAGYVMSTATQVQDDFMNRHYWRVQRHL